MKLVLTMHEPVLKMGRPARSVLSWLLAALPYGGAMAWGGWLSGWGGALEAPLGIALAPWFFVSVYVTFLDTYPVWAVVFFPLLYLAAFASMVAGIKCWSRWWGKVLLGWSYFALGWVCAFQILAVT